MDSLNGWIEVVCGCMFCGKTEELIRRVRRATLAKMKVQVFKPRMDCRYEEETVSSHSGLSVQAIPVEDAWAITKILEEGVRVVAIDEAQFFGDVIVDVCKAMTDQGIRVIVAGLDQDFRGEPFGPIPLLMAIADEVLKLTAICMVCGRPATKTQRLVDGRPALPTDPIVLVGGAEKYEARCRNCHQVPRPAEAEQSRLPL